MDTVSNTLLSEDSRRKERGTNFQNEVNMIETRGRNESCERNKSKAKSRSQSRTRTKCYYCSKEGHKRFECRFLKKDHKVGTVHPNLFVPKKKDYTCIPSLLGLIECYPHIVRNKYCNHTFIVEEFSILGLVDFYFSN